MDFNIDNLCCGIFILDKDFNLLKINKNVTLITEYEENDFKEKTIEIINETFLEKIYLNISKKDFNPIQDSLIIKTKSNKEKEIHRYVNYEINNNILDKIYISIYDITTFKKYQIEFFNYQKIETLGEVTKAIALEYNNLLTAIIGFSSFLKDIVNPSNEIYNYLNIIEKSANRASSLTNQLLSFAGTNYFRQTNNNLNKSIEYIINLFQKSLPSFIKIKLNLYPRDINILWDESQIHQIIINTFLNAKEAIEKKGNKNGLIEISTNIENQMIIYQIKDNGIGIKDDIKDKIFEPYFTTKDVKKHSGLGLSVTEGIVKNMGGNITFVNDKDYTLFTIKIPYKESNINDTLINFKGNNEKILIIDDVDTIRNLATILLKQKGYNCYSTGSGKESLELIKKEHFDLILLDVVMPEMSGEETFYEIKKINPDIPVILLTGCTEEKLVNKMVEEYNLEIIQKPFQTFEFYNKINKILKK